MGGPFFSVIIPTYNPNKYLPRLLESIANNKCADEIEIILSDDCSEEDLDEVTVKFQNLTLVQICNDEHTGFPRTGRQHGADVARGKWMTFADQDDVFLDHAFDRMKAYIEAESPEFLVVTDFIEEFASDGRRVNINGTMGWTHGKFYEKACWDKYDIRYDDVNYCEDINLSTKIDCFMTANDMKTFKYDKPVYLWNRRDNSLADEEYFANSMPDYITATLGVVTDYVEKCNDNKEMAEKFYIKFLGTFLHIYFYFQSSILFNRNDILLEALNVSWPFWQRFKETTGFTNDDIVNFMHTQLIGLYQKIRNEDFQQIPFVEQITFTDWVKRYW